MPEAQPSGPVLQDMNTVEAALRAVTHHFRQAGLDTPELDARLLIADALGVERSVLIGNPGRGLSAADRDRIEAHAGRRLGREPVSRILGRREFFGRMLELGRSTLDPRPETETIVEAALDIVRKGLVPGGEGPRVLDAGTGSGAILLSILAELPEATGVGVDIDEEALAIAARNCAVHGVGDRSSFVRADWLGSVTGGFDLIVGNPPYIPSALIAALDAEVCKYDPRVALDGGADGLAAYRAILKDVRRILAAAGWLVLEIGERQADAVLDLCRQAGLEIGREEPYVRCDLAGRLRCVAAKARW